jgi:hypothetical protein
MTPPPLNIDGTDITGATIDGTDVSEVTVDGTQVFSAIAGSPIHRYNSTETGFSVGQTVDPWDDRIGSVDLSAVGDPTLSAGALNGNDAVTFDGTDDGVEYNNVGLSEPATIIIGYHQENAGGNQTVWFEQAGFTEFINDLGDDEIFFEINDNFSNPQGVSYSGDSILTILVDDTDSVLRVNGTQVTSGGSAPGADVLTSGAFFYDQRGQRHVSGDVGIIDVFNGRLSGSGLEDAEQRVETELDMNVL